MNKDYHWEYLEVLDEVLHEFIDRVKAVDSGAFWLDGVSVEKGVVDHLWDDLMFFKEKRTWYNACRSDGKSREKVKEELGRWLAEHTVGPLSHYRENDYEKIRECPWREALDAYAGELVVLCLTMREWEYWQPFVKGWTGKMVVLVPFEMPGDWEFEGDILLLEHCWLAEEYVHNDYLKEVMPKVFRAVNCHAVLLELLRPCAVLVMTGCCMEAELLAAQCRGRGIPSVCVQQGWPSVMHTKFRNMGYDYFLTWGEKFNLLWKRWNARPDFVATGYLYGSESRKSVAGGIGFFLQVPVITLDETHVDEMLEFILFCAASFPERRMYIRQHPVGRKSKEEYTVFKGIGNVVFADDMPLEELFGEIDVSVSFFSSTLMEGVLYGVVPFVFDPSFSSRYYPDIEQEGIGLVSGSQVEAREKICWLLDGPYELFGERGKVVRKEYFAAWGEAVVVEMVRFIEQLRVNYDE